MPTVELAAPTQGASQKHFHPDHCLNKQVPYHRRLIKNNQCGGLALLADHVWMHWRWQSMGKPEKNHDMWFHLSTLPFRGRYEQAWKKRDLWRSMLASTCPHFRFGDATSKLEKTKHMMTFHACKHWFTLFLVSGALRANLKKHDLWRSMLASACPHFRFGGATSKPEKNHGLWRSMLASTCPHFRFGGATGKLEKHDIYDLPCVRALVPLPFRGRYEQTWKTWHMTFYACKHLSTLPFWGRYEQA